MENEQIVHFEQQGVELVTKARELKIVDQSTRETAVSFRADVNQRLKKIETYFKVYDPSIPGSGMKTKAYDTWKSICNQETALTGKFEEAKKIVDAEINRDYQEQKRIREEAERKAREEAAEKERKERERLEAQAMKQMEKGNFEKAEEKLAQAEQVFVPVVTPEAEAQKTVRVNGATLSMIEDIEVSVVDIRVFLSEIISGKVPPHIIDVRLGDLKKFCKAMGYRKHDAIPGILITETSHPASRRN